MKSSTQTRNPHSILLSVITLIVLFAGTTIAQAQQIAARPLTPQEIHDTFGENVPANVFASGGLLTVGIGENVYLEAQVPKGTVVSGVVWSVEDRPLGGSVADFMDSPLPSEMEIYSPGDRVVLEVADRKLFIPDIEGRYTVKAVVSTDGDPIVMEAFVTGALYTGVGIIDGMSPAYPQCALCHPENANGWSETNHSTVFARALDGMVSSHWNESCVECHVLGKNPAADNESFLSIAEEIGWTFPETLEPGNWAALPDELKEKANVQCEHCHGAGSEHHGDITTISVSLSSGDCGQCHDEDPYHRINQEWNLSNHSVATRYPTGPGRGSCVQCHSGIGFIEELDGVAEKSTDYEAIVCAACHDPHGGENEHQLRTLADITLKNGHVVTEGGNGKLCMNCHQSRRNADEYVQGNVSSHYGPHYGIQGDLFNGTNAIEYDGKVKGQASGHLYALENSCASCHMQAAADNQRAGGHTFKLVNDNGTPDDESDDIDMVAGCMDCHGELESFDDFTADYNFDGTAEPIQTEIKHLMEALAMHLPPVGSPEVELSSDIEYTDAEKKGLFNYRATYQDHSFGMHNPKYISSMLRASIEDLGDPFNAVLGGTNVPTGGEWWYSQWFEFYAPSDSEGWIYHFEHGYLFVEQRDDDKIYLYDLRLGTWMYTTPESYPNMFNVTEGAWYYYYGTNRNGRIFYNRDASKWVETR